LLNAYDITATVDIIYIVDYTQEFKTEHAQTMRHGHVIKLCKLTGIPMYVNVHVYV